MTSTQQNQNCCQDVLLGYKLELQLNLILHVALPYGERSKGIYYSGGVIDAGYAARF